LRGKRRKKILKFSKRVENPQIEELRVLRVIFRKACEPRVIWREACKVRLKFRISSWLRGFFNTSAYGHMMETNLCGQTYSKRNIYGQTIKTLI
jgi:hypothetical protein